MLLCTLIYFDSSSAMFFLNISFSLVTSCICRSLPWKTLCSIYHNDQVHRRRRFSLVQRSHLELLQQLTVLFLQLIAQRCFHFDVFLHELFRLKGFTVLRELGLIDTFHFLRSRNATCQHASLSLWLLGRYHFGMALIFVLSLQFMIDGIQSTLRLFVCFPFHFDISIQCLRRKNGWIRRQTSAHYSRRSFVDR